MTEIPAHRCFIIAEVGVNHNGDLDQARKLVDVAAEAGADAVKFQTFSADRLVTPNAQKARYQKANLPGDDGQYQMLKALELNADAHKELAILTNARNIEFMSTPFDVESLRFLIESKVVSRIKLGSGEIGNLPLLWEAGRTGLPIILSTGMATLEEISDSLAAVYCGALGIEEPALSDLRSVVALPACEAVRSRITLLQCTTDYPARLHDLNLRVIPALRDQFGVATGFSDHSEGMIASLGAVSLGAEVVEKHFTLSRDLPGPDHKASLEPDELNAYISSVRELEKTLGSAQKAPTTRELENVAAARKSLVAARAISAGSVLTAHDLACLRPGGGLAPTFFWDVVGKPAIRDYALFEQIDFEQV
ncbi:MAG: N-acetylneuraminate synthase [Hyphomicrobiales bacterium]